MGVGGGDFFFPEGRVQCSIKRNNYMTEWIPFVLMGNKLCVLDTKPCHFILFFFSNKFSLVRKDYLYFFYFLFF